MNELTRPCIAYHNGAPANLPELLERVNCGYCPLDPVDVRPILEELAELVDASLLALAEQERRRELALRRTHVEPNVTLRREALKQTRTARELARRHNVKRAAILRTFSTTSDTGATG